MAFSKKTWKDRIVQYLNRRRLTDVDTGDIRTVTVTRDEGGITEDGDIFNAATMNDLEDRIEDAFDGLTAADIPYTSGVSVADKIDDVESTILTVHSKNVSINFDSSGEGAVTDTDINHIIAVEDMMSDSGVYPAYFAYKARGNSWRIKTLNRSNINFTSSGLVSSTRTVKIYYLA